MLLDDEEAEVGGGLIPSRTKWATIAALEVEEEVSSIPREGVHLMDV